MDIDTYHPLPNPPYMSTWTIEQSYDLPYWRRWFETNWTLSIWISLGYIFCIFFVKFLMVNRAPYSLRGVLCAWNFLLATFSILGTLRTWPEIVFILGGVGFESSVCRRDHHNIGSAFWGLLFTLSKAFELGDTLFIVLRKQPLIFLHWYHHITVLGYTWFTYYTYDSTSRWFMVMNYPVHSLMYTYYGLKSLRLRVPRFISMLITILQLTQMVVGVVVNVYALYKKRAGEVCYVKEEHIHLALIMYASYFGLFLNFFYAAYVKRVERRRLNKEKIR